MPQLGPLLIVVKLLSWIKISLTGPVIWIGYAAPAPLGVMTPPIVEIETLLLEIVTFDSS